MSRLLPVLALTALAATAACTTEEHEHEDPETDACEHLAAGPAEAVTAATTATATDAPDVSKAHTRFDVATGGTAEAPATGYVKFVVAKAGEYLLVADKAVPLAVIDAAGATVAARSTAAKSDKCSVVLHRSLYDLKVGTVKVRIGPTVEGKVGVLFEALVE